MNTYAPGRNVHVAGKKMNHDKETIGKPDGPPVYVEEFGREVGSFTNPRTDLYKAKDPGKSSIMYHVPFEFRGYYKPEQVADYDEDEFEYLTDIKGYAICTMRKADGTPCSNKAMHMSWKCAAHGGKLHPLDKVLNDERALMPGQDGNMPKSYISPDIEEKMTRWQKLCHGLISVEDLDDEELARGQCRDKNGGFTSKPPRNVPKALHDQMVSHLMVRAQEMFRVNLPNAIKALGTIAAGDAYEPADRIKASALIIDRVLGKNADVVVHKQDEPWQVVFQAIGGGSRAESRLARGLDPETGEPIEDAELVEEYAETVPSTGMPTGGTSVLPYGDIEYVGEVDIVGADYPEAEQEFRDDEGYSDRSGMAVSDTVGDVPDGADGSADAEADDKASIRDRLKAGRRQRYAAREAGRDDVAQTPMVMTKARKQEDGTYLLGFKNMRTPAKHKDQGDFRHRV